MSQEDTPWPLVTTISSQVFPSCPTGYLCRQALLPPTSIFATMASNAHSKRRYQLLISETIVEMLLLDLTRERVLKKTQAPHTLDKGATPRYMLCILVRSGLSRGHMDVESESVIILNRPMVTLARIPRWKGQYGKKCTGLGGSIVGVCTRLIYWPLSTVTGVQQLR